MSIGKITQCIFRGQKGDSNGFFLSISNALNELILSVMFFLCFENNFIKNRIILSKAAF